MAAGYRIFDVVLKRRIAVTPSLLRCVFSGPDIARMKHESPDQRIKLLLAPEGAKATRMAVTESWYQDYLAMPKETRPVMRTYTLRALRREALEMDVEFVLHGDSGPASAWAMDARPGESLQIVAPNDEAAQSSGGFEWINHDGIRDALLIADETALPAATGILELLATKPEPPFVQAFFSVPLTEDIQPLNYPFATLHWLARDRGDDLLCAVDKNVFIPERAQTGAFSAEEQGESNVLLWEQAGEATTFQAWVAAESSLVKSVRRTLLEKHHLNRSCASFMAYWARGRS